MTDSGSVTPAQRLGVTLAPSKRIPVEAVVRLALEAERLGYESLWIPETWSTDAVSLLAVLARETQRIRVAAGVFNVYSRSAALLAQTSATLQSLSDGRFILGLGVSGPRVIRDWHGMEFGLPIQRTREYVEVIRMALRGQRVEYDGSLLHLRGFTLGNPPASPVRVYLAALGPRNVRLAGEVADGWLPIFACLGHLAALIGDLHAGAQSAGRDTSEIDIAAYLPIGVGTQADRLLQQHLAFYIGGMGDFYHSFISRVGFARQAGGIRTAWQAGRRLDAIAAVDSELLDSCTLGADHATAGRRLQQYRNAGITLPILSFPHGSSEDDVAATLEALSPVRSANGRRKQPLL